MSEAHAIEAQGGSVLVSDLPYVLLMNLNQEKG